MGNSLSSMNAVSKHDTLKITNGNILIERMNDDYIRAQNQKNSVLDERAKEIKKQEDTIQQQQQQIDDDQETIQNLHKEMESKDDLIKLQHNEIIRLKSELESLIQHKATVIKQEQSLRRESINLTDECEEKMMALMNEVVEKDKNMQKIEEERAKVKKDHTALMANYEEMETELIAAESVTQALQEENEELMNEQKRFQKEIERLSVGKGGYELNTQHSRFSVKLDNPQ